MVSKKRAASNEAELKATVKKLSSKLERAEAKAERWKKTADRHKSAAAQSEAQTKKLRKRLAKAIASSRPAKAAPEVVPVEVVPVEVETPVVVATEEPATPDAGWTVAQLRDEARARGLTGLSGKPKAELLAALS
ncbi:MAG: hypothetical protein ABI776_07760 [Nocardioidaceae bacterium]